MLNPHCLLCLVWDNFLGPQLPILKFTFLESLRNLWLFGINKKDGCFFFSLGPLLGTCDEISSNLLKEEWGAILCLVGENPAFYDFYFQACLKITTDLVVNQRQYKMISILRVKANRSWGMNIKVPGQWLSFPSILSNFHVSQDHLRWMKQTWNLSKISHDRIFGPKILHTKNA